MSELEQKLHIEFMNLQAGGFVIDYHDYIEWLVAKITALLSRAEKAEAELAVLREQTRWIPVEERLPTVSDNEHKTVLAINMDDPNYYPFVAGYTKACGFDALKATHWRPIDLPEVKE